MHGRPIARGARRPLIVDLIVAVAVSSFLLAGMRAILEGDLDGEHRLAATLALLGIPLVASLYGASAAIEMRRGWVGASIASGLLHASLVLASLAGIVVLSAFSPMAAGMVILAESVLLLWSSSWP